MRRPCVAPGTRDLDEVRTGVIRRPEAGVEAVADERGHAAVGLLRRLAIGNATAAARPFGDHRAGADDRNPVVRCNGAGRCDRLDQRYAGPVGADRDHDRGQRGVEP